MDVLEQPSHSTSFKFPFTDNDEGDLNLSKSFRELQGEKTPLRAKGQKKVGKSRCIDSPSDLSVGLSPIARIRDSDASGISLGLSPIAKNRDSDASGTSLGLSPIARSRDSDESGISCMRSLGDEANIADTTTIDEENKQQKSSTLTSEALETNPLSPVSDRSSSPVTGDLKSAMKQVGEHSSNFIDKIRDAAHKRKVAVTRSRDSLVAKEKEQLRSIAESKTLMMSLNEDLQALGKKNGDAAKENNFHKSGNSKPKRSYKNKSSDFGGVGVPKVEKRPTTTPLSPMLGVRRKGGENTTRLGKNSNKFPGRGSKDVSDAKLTNRKLSSDIIKKKLKASANRYLTPRQKKGDPVLPGGNSSKVVDKTTVFKARQAPASTGRGWNAGQIGIPKVSKRAVTVPVSPCLGPKRQSRISIKSDDESHTDSSLSKVEMNHSRRTNELSISTQSRIMTPLSIKGSPLLGLNIIDSIKKDKCKTKEMNESLTPTHSSCKPFVPRSTTRAKIRKNYDIRRNENRHRKLEEERERLQSEIKAIHRELKILSKDLT